MTTELEDTMPARTTNAGLEAWLSGTGAQPAAETPGAGLVNLAEGLALEAPSSARRMTGADGAELMVDPERDAYHFESTALKPLAAILLQSASHWAPASPEMLAAARSATDPQPLERLRFYAGLIATPGILARKLGRDERHQLARWPETEREFPKHFRIAKAMLSRPATVDEIVSASGASREDVIDYVNASYAAGRLTQPQPSARHADHAASGKASRGKRLLARLNKPLFTR